MDEQEVQESSLDDLVNALGGTSEEIEQPTDTTTTQEQPAEEPKEEPQEQPKQEEVKPTASDNTKKLNEAFARMRVQNTQYEKTLKGVASMLGLEMKDNPDDLLQALQEKIVDDQAKKQNVPPELLKRLDELEQDKHNRELNDIRTQAFLGFQKVKDRFGLDDDTLQEFATELQLDGINPFITPVDLESAYIRKHFDDIVTAAKEEGIKEEQARAAKASANSSTPSTKQGVQSNTDSSDNIKTVADLNKWFNSQSVK